MAKIIGFAGGGFINVDLGVEDPPALIGQIPSLSGVLGSAGHQFNLAQYYVGAVTYAISPAIEAGWTFDTNTGLLSIDSDAAGNFGPYTVTATNPNGGTPSNAFSVRVAAQAAQRGIKSMVRVWRGMRVF